MPELSRALSFAREIAELGGRIAMGHFGSTPERKRKPDGTWVTEADWAVEAQIRIRISRAYPEHNILGEEEGLTAAGGGEPIKGAPTWVIDPIDGTHNYMLGIPIWATLVSLRIDDESVVGVAHAPALGETYEGARGLGARFNETTIRVDPVASLSDAHVVFGAENGFIAAGMGDFFEALVSSCWRSRGFGDFWGHMLVARGAAHVMVEPELSLWDVAALEPIVTEAGGRLTHLDGTSWSQEGTCLTTCGSLHDEVVAMAKRATGGAPPAS